MAPCQVVRMTRAENTTGYPDMLREMMSYLGFSFYPEFVVYALPRAFGLDRFSAEVRIPSERPQDPVLEACAAQASTVELAIQRVAYVMVTVLRKKYADFDNSPFKYVPKGIYYDTGVHTTHFDEQDATGERDRLFRTAQLVQHQDRVTQALFVELDAVREQLYVAHQHLAAYTTLQPADISYPHPIVLPEYCSLPNVGGYIPDLGPCLTPAPRWSEPIYYGPQGWEAHTFTTPRVPLRYDVSSGHRRYTRF